MSGTALGVLKLGIPAGGIVVPFLMSILAGVVSFQASLALLPFVMLLGLILAYTNKADLEIDSGNPDFTRAQAGKNPGPKQAIGNQSGFIFLQTLH